MDLGSWLSQVGWVLLPFTGMHGSQCAAYAALGPRARLPQWRSFI